MDSKKYTCVFCDYSARCTRTTSKEEQFNRHCLSQRHIRKKKNNIKPTKETKAKNNIERKNKIKNNIERKNKIKNKIKELMKENERLTKENERLQQKNHTLRSLLVLIANTVKKSLDSAMAL